MERTALTVFGRQIREYFLLEEAARSSAARPPAQRDTVRAFRTAANGRFRVAQDLRGPDEIRAALTLYREGLGLLTLAFLASKDGAIDPASLDPSDVVRRLDVALAGEIRPPSVLFDDGMMSLPPAKLLEVDRLPPDEAARLADELDAATRWLLERVEGRGPRELVVVRIARVATLAVAALALLAWFGSWILSPKNLAAGKPASSSSVTEIYKPDGAVDGSKNGRFGFHSAEEDGPWWSVDLGKSYLLTKVKVFGRGDCCFDQSVPLGLEVSSDGVSFQQVATRSEALSESEPWIVKMSVAARFVRLRTLRRSYLVLSEVEVYGDKPPSR